MENFREHEKEYKAKKMTKEAMLNETERKGKFKFDGSDGSQYSDYGEEGEMNGLSDEADDLPNEAQDPLVERMWLAVFLSEHIKGVVTRYESELEKLRNKKAKGGAKKNKEKINAL